MRLLRRDRKDAQERVVLALIGAEHGQPSAVDLLDGAAMEVLFEDATQLGLVVPYALARLMSLLASHEKEKVRRNVIKVLENLSVACPALVNGTLWRMSASDGSKRVRQEAEASLAVARANQEQDQRERDERARHAQAGFAQGA